MLLTYLDFYKSSHLGKLCLVLALMVLPQHFVQSPLKLKV